jgi:hypothetical protein
VAAWFGNLDKDQFLRREQDAPRAEEPTPRLSQFHWKGRLPPRAPVNDTDPFLDIPRKIRHLYLLGFRSAARVPHDAPPCQERIPTPCRPPVVCRGLVDLAVLARRPQWDDPDWRSELEADLSDAVRGLEPDLSILNGASPFLMFEVARTGRPLFEAEPGMFAGFRSRAAREYYDNETRVRRQAEFLARATRRSTGHGGRAAARGRRAAFRADRVSMAAGTGPRVARERPSTRLCSRPRCYEPPPSSRRGYRKRLIFCDGVFSKGSRCSSTRCTWLKLASLEFTSCWMRPSSAEREA